jgi:hypothetical protein
LKINIRHKIGKEVRWGGETDTDRKKKLLDIGSVTIYM